MRIPAIHPLPPALAAAVAVFVFSSPARAQVTFYANDGFEGRAYTSQTQVNNLKRFGFNDRASSVVVRTDRWQICDDVNFKGRCMVLRPGQYPSLSAMGMADRISSARAVKRHARFDDRQYAPAPLVADRAT